MGIKNARLPLRILHLEDSPVDSELVALAFKRGGVPCVIKRVDSKAAFEAALNSQSIDLILADYSLPSFDGNSALVIAEELCPELPFIFVSGSLGEELAIEALKAGATDYVLKSRIDRLIPSVERAVNEYDNRRKARAAELALLDNEKRFRFLAEASAALSSSLNYRATLIQVVHLAVPQIADACSVVMAEGDQDLQLAPAKVSRSTLRLLAVFHVISRETERARELIQAFCEGATARSVFRTNSPLFIEEVNDETLKETIRSAEHANILRELQIKSYICLPIVARDRTLGTISLATVGERRFNAGDLPLARDLAGRAAMAIESAMLYQEAQEAIRARDEFLSIASHELKTPLTTLQLEIQMLLRQARKSSAILPAIQSPNAEPKHHSETGSTQVPRAKLEVMEQQTRKLSKLVNNLLDVSRVAAGRFEIRREEVDLSSVTRAVVERFAQQMSLAGCTISLIANSPVIGHWDRLRIEQVVTNLVTNAMKYGHGKPVNVRVESALHIARLVVQDNGIGISAEDQERIFNRFERASASRNYGGLGLGLYIVKKIVDALGGTVSVSSQLGAGSTFTVELPI